METQPVVILDDNGSALGVVVLEDDKMILCDNHGKHIKEVSGKATIQEVKQMLVSIKLAKVIV